MSEQMVYVVTDGVYSDYTIRAIFSVREEADAYADKLASHDVNVEEWPIDNPPTIHTYTEVVMGKDGMVYETNQYHYDYDGVLKELVPSFEVSGDAWSHFLIHEVETADEERAIKVTNELRTRLLAENIWPEYMGYDAAVERMHEMLGFVETPEGV